MLDDRFGRLVLEGDVQQDLADSGHGSAGSELTDEQAHALVARLGEAEVFRDDSEPPVDVGDRLSAVVEPADGRDQPSVQSRRRRGHVQSVPERVCRVRAVTEPTLQHSVARWFNGAGGR